MRRRSCCWWGDGLDVMRGVVPPWRQWERSNARNAFASFGPPLSLSDRERDPVPLADAVHDLVMYYSIAWRR